jgi:CcmD family protein
MKQIAFHRFARLAVRRRSRAAGQLRNGRCAAGRIALVAVVTLVALVATAHGDDAARKAQQEACEIELDRMSKEARAKGEEAVAQLGPVTRIVTLLTTMPACMEILQNPAFSSRLDQILVRRVHEEEADQYTRDQRHVLMAYLAIWVLTAGFVAFLSLRQSKLRGEIERLRGELARATKDAEQ